jgi:hypothetical protein
MNGASIVFVSISVPVGSAFSFQVAASIFGPPVSSVAISNFHRKPPHQHTTTEIHFIAVQTNI